MKIRTIFLICFAAACLPAVGWSAWVARQAQIQWDDAAAAVHTAIAMGDALHLVEVLAIERAVLQAKALNDSSDAEDWPRIQARGNAILAQTERSLSEAGLSDEAVMRARKSLAAARSRVEGTVDSIGARPNPDLAAQVVAELEQRAQEVQLALAQAEGKSIRPTALTGVYLSIASLAVDMRLAAGARSVRITRWLIGHSLTPTQLDELMYRTGELQQAWQRLKRQVLAVGNPPGLAAAIETTGELYFREAEPRNLSLIAILRAGGDRPPIPLLEWHRWTAKTLSSLLMVRDAAIAEGVAQGEALVFEAQERLAIAAAATFGLILLAGGAFLVLRSRLVLPVQDLTTVVTRLAGGDVSANVPGQGRRDEIGAMAAAVEIFRQNAVKLRETNMRFDAALSNMSHGLAMYDANEILVVCNSRVCDLSGIPEGSLRVGMTLRQVYEVLVSFGHFPGQTVEELYREEQSLHACQGAKSYEVIGGKSVILITSKTLPGGGFLYTLEDISERRQNESRIAYMAHHDSLTGLPNRVFFQLRLEEALARSRRGEHFSVLYLDLDRFKPVNDTFGHPAGDALLQEVAKRLQSELRETDTIARLGGDEFAILQGFVEYPSQTTALAQRLIKVVTTPYQIFGNHVEIGVSIGIVVTSSDEETSEALFKKADIALYQSKANGRGTWRFFEPEMNAFMQARRLLELDLRQAIARDQFELHYQPVVNLRTGWITGLEALLRWHHPERGLVPPMQFIALAEEIGLIGVVGEWVLSRACAEAAQWHDDLRIAVNVSALQIRSGRRFTEVLSEVLRQSGLPIHRLELEITETAILQDTEETLATLNSIKDLGVAIALDDFGTGYSSLSHLSHFPFNRVKIDKSFVRGLGPEENECTAIVRALIGLCASLGLGITAEGVETREQMDWLMAEGDVEVQGFIFSKAVPAADIPALIETLSKGAAAVAVT